jgi:exopolysaccharide biosynthesis polyprenyl glycosylphosphotransferase
VSLALEHATGAREWQHPTLSPLPSTRRHPITRLTKRLKVLQIGADAAAVATALLLAYLMSGLAAENDRGSRRQLLFGLALLPLWLATFRHYRLYSARMVASRMEEASRLLRAIVVATIGVAMVSYLVHYQASRSLVLGTALLAFPLCLAERQALRSAFRRMRSSGRLRRRAVIIGANEEADSFAAMFHNTPHLGYDAVGFCSDDEVLGSSVPWLGRLDAAPELVAAAGATTAVIATTSLGPSEANRVVRNLHDAGIHVELSAGLRDIPADRLSVRDLGRHAVFYLEPTVRSGWRAVAKRAFDVSISAVALALAAPILGVCAVLVKLTSSGRVFFHQERIGQGGVPFRIHKLRTMVQDADAMVVDLTDQNEADGPLFKLRDDPRVTPIGKVLRRTSLDELPQLWNVLKGEMSLVGPRPALERELPGWTPELHNRLRVKPGVTGMWQVSGRSSGSFDDYVRHDLFYVDNWTLARDLVILGKTIPCVLMRRGAC